MSTYRVIRLVGSSPNSWEEAAKTAVEQAAQHLEDLRVAEVELLDMRMMDNKAVEYPCANPRLVPLSSRERRRSVGLADERIDLTGRRP